MYIRPRLGPAQGPPRVPSKRLQHIVIVLPCNPKTYPESSRLLEFSFQVCLSKISRCPVNVSNPLCKGPAAPKFGHTMCGHCSAAEARTTAASLTKRAPITQPYSNCSSDEPQCAKQRSSFQKSTHLLFYPGSLRSVRTKRKPDALQRSSDFALDHEQRHFSRTRWPEFHFGRANFCSGLCFFGMRTMA